MIQNLMDTHTHTQLVTRGTQKLLDNIDCHSAGRYTVAEEKVYRNFPYFGKITKNTTALYTKVPCFIYFLMKTI